LQPKSYTPLRTFTNFTPGYNIVIDFAAVLDGLLPDTPYEIHLVAITANGIRSPEVVHSFTTPSVLCDPISAPNASDLTICRNDSAELVASGASASQNYHWYTDSTQVTPIVGITSPVLITDPLVADTTFFVSIVNGTCESDRTQISVIVQNCNVAPVITPPVIRLAIASTLQADISTWLSDVNGNLDFTPLTVIGGVTTQGASVSLSGSILTLDYSNISFSGIDNFTLRVCDTDNECTQQDVQIEVVGDLIIYNAVSPNGDGLNDLFYIENIDILPDARTNKVTIYNRWGDEVFSITDYNNNDRVFTGVNNNGKELPNGIYFYKIESIRGSTLNGYLSLKR